MSKRRTPLAALSRFPWKLFRWTTFSVSSVQTFTAKAPPCLNCCSEPPSCLSYFIVEIYVALEQLFSANRCFVEPHVVASSIAIIFAFLNLGLTFIFETYHYKRCLLHLVSCGLYNGAQREWKWFVTVNMAWRFLAVVLAWGTKGCNAQEHLP